MLFSVIIPVYNVEKYVRRCIESVVNQTFKDYEIILVDDGSTDSSGIICDEFAASYSECVAIHKHNAGLAAARNTGIDKAMGKYIVFLDSDDYIDKEFFMKVRYELEVRKYDTCSWGMRRVDENGRYLYEMRFDGAVGLIQLNSSNMQKFIMDTFLQYKIGWEAWGFIFNRTLLNDIKLRFHPEIKYAEDIIFTFEYLLHVKSISKIPDVLYNYTYRADSITAETQLEKVIAAMMGDNYEIMRISVENNKNSFDRHVSVIMPELLYGSMLIHFMPNWLKQKKIDEIAKILNNYAYSVDIVSMWKKIIKHKKEFQDVFGSKKEEQLVCWIKEFINLGESKNNE